MLFLDTETHRIRPGETAPPAVCIQIAGAHGSVHVVKIIEKFLHVLFAQDFTYVGHNIAFDLLCLTRQNPSIKPRIWELYELGLIRDTMIRQKLLDIAQGVRRKSYSLSVVAGIYGYAKDAENPWRLRYSELRNTPVELWPTEALYYAQHDVEVTRDIYYAQAGGGPIVDEQAQVRVAWWLQHVTEAGIWTDRGAVSALQSKIAAEQAHLRSTLTTCGLLRASGSRDTKVAQRLMQNSVSKKLTPKGKISLARDACADSGVELLRQYARYTSLQTLGKRVSDLDVEGPVNPQYNSLVATGRTSCYRGRMVAEGGALNSLQLQNMPRDGGVRECFIPLPGEAIISVDYCGMELATWAQICVWVFGHSKLADAIKAGIDPHLLLAAEILGISYATAEAQKNTKKVKDVRSGLAKAANFGFLGGLGVPRFRTYAQHLWGILLSPTEAEDLRQKWGRCWESDKYFHWIRHDHVWRDDRTTIVHFWSGRVRGGATYTEACNSYFQGLAADVAKLAGYLILREIETNPSSELSGWKVWNFCHDEFLLRGPADGAAAAMARVRERMETAGAVIMPDVPLRTEGTITDRWSK